MSSRPEASACPSVNDVTISTGVAVAAGCETDSELLARADVALYESKVAGRDQVVLSLRGA